MASRGGGGSDLKRGAPKREAFFRKVQDRIRAFSLAPADGDGEDRRTNVRLFEGDVLRGTIQTLPRGFSNNLHYHPAYEGLWVVLKGRVRFYGRDDTVLGEFGPLEGIFIPRNGRYRFAQAGDEAAQLLQVRGDARDGSNKRVDVGERHPGYGNKRLMELRAREGLGRRGGDGRDWPMRENQKEGERS